MGNRAVITTEQKQIGVYLHWNGGRDSVQAFLLFCKLKGFRTPENDCYGWARLCQVIGNYFGGDLSIGIDKYNRLDTDNGDNGVYIIKDWEIVGREFYEGAEQNNYELRDMLRDINEAQPESERLSAKVIEDAVNCTMEPITTKQIRAIHAIVSTLGIEEARYRQVLNGLFGVTSSKNLSEGQASLLIDTLNKLKG